MIRLSGMVIAFMGLLLPMSSAYAIGDSGGCNPDASPLGRALKHGAPQDLENVIVRFIDSQEEKLVLKKLQFMLPGGDEARQSWRQEMARTVLEGTYKRKTSCRRGHLLPVAIRNANLEVVRYLLGSPMGLTLNVPEDILFNCKYTSPFYTDDQRRRRRDAFALILQMKKADVNAPVGKGAMVSDYLLGVCNEPELIELFLEYGADASLEYGVRGKEENLRDRAILDALRVMEGGSVARNYHGVERARIYSRILGPSIEGRHVEERARRFCNQLIGGERWNSNTCRELSTFIKAAPGTFGED